MAPTRKELYGTRIGEMSMMMTGGGGFSASVLLEEFRKLKEEVESLKEEVVSLKETVTCLRDDFNDTDREVERLTERVWFLEP